MWCLASVTAYPQHSGSVLSMPKGVISSYSNWKFTWITNFSGKGLLQLISKGYLSVSAKTQGRLRGLSTTVGFSPSGIYLETDLVLQVCAFVPLAEKREPDDRYDSSCLKKRLLVQPPQWADYAGEEWFSLWFLFGCRVYVLSNRDQGTRRHPWSRNSINPTPGQEEMENGERNYEEKSVSGLVGNAYSKLGIKVQIKMVVGQFRKRARKSSEKESEML